STDTADTEPHPLSLHDALPICEADVRLLADQGPGRDGREQAGQAQQHRRSANGHRTGSPLGVVPLSYWYRSRCAALGAGAAAYRSEEHTSELQSRENLVCRLLL